MLLQTSPESAEIFVLLQKIFRKQTPSQLAEVATAAGLSTDEYQVLGSLSWKSVASSRYSNIK